MKINGTEISATAASLAAIEAARAAGCEIQEIPWDGFWLSTNVYGSRPEQATLYTVVMTPEFSVGDLFRLLGVDLEPKYLEMRWGSQRIQAGAVELIIHPAMDECAETDRGTVLAQSLCKSSRRIGWDAFRMPHVSVRDGNPSAQHFV